MYDVTECCLSYTLLVSVVQSGAVVTRSNLSQIYTQYCIDRSRLQHDDVIKWKNFPRNWLFVWGIHRSPVNSPHKGQWRGALMFSLICIWISGWVNNREAGDLRRCRGHYDVNVMFILEKHNRHPFLWVVIIWCYQCSYAVNFTYFRIRCALLICTALSCGHKEM